MRLDRAAAEPRHGIREHLRPVPRAKCAVELGGRAEVLSVRDRWYVDFARLQRISASAIRTPVAITIAVVKATFVLLYFMHLRWSERLTALFIGAAFVWLGLMMAFTFSDTVTRNLLPFPLR